MNRRATRTALVMTIALLTAACAGGDDAAPQSSAASSTALPTTPADPTTSTPPGTERTTSETSPNTTEPPVTSSSAPTTTAPTSMAACEAATTVLDADVDGDGAPERVGLAAREGGQLLVACGDGRSSTLELEYGVWYVGAADIEPDGSDEVFLGAADIGDEPGRPQMLLFQVRADDGRLIADAAGGGLVVGGTWGAACDDVDGDGVRELVRVDVDLGASGAVTGGYGLQCGESVEMTRVTPPPTICDTEGTHYVLDLDRDGRDDVVVRRRSTAPEVLAGFEFGAPAVAICLASGATDEARFGGMGEVFAVSDGSGDRATIWTGGTSVSAAFLDPLVVVDDRIVPVASPEGPLFFEDGFTFPDRVATFGCTDPDRDGHLDLTQVVGTRTGDTVEWTRRSYAIAGAEAELIAESSGTVEVTPRSSEEHVVTADELEQFEALAGDADCRFLEPDD